jgi:hypothetical protein
MNTRWRSPRIKISQVITIRLSQGCQQMVRIWNAEYVNGDYNLLNLDVLALSETHLTNGETIDEYDYIMDNMNHKTKAHNWL